MIRWNWCKILTLSQNETLQGKDPLAEVIKAVFSVIKLAKIVKKTFATTSVYGYKGFGGAFNGSELKELWDGINLYDVSRPIAVKRVFMLYGICAYMTHDYPSLRVFSGKLHV